MALLSRLSGLSRSLRSSSTRAFSLKVAPAWRSCVSGFRFEARRPMMSSLARYMSSKAGVWTPPTRPKAGVDGYQAIETLRNVAIIAHVDHGKTTLVDCLLRQSHSGAGISGERVMDSNALEQERGITIMSKCTRVDWNGFTLNIVDTPGHADFGGEVERVLSMVDGVILVIDATEGPMPQTKFVLHKALQHNLKPVVVFNKVDRATSRVGNGEVQNETFDLFVQLEANDEQLDFPILFASARQGWAVDRLDLVAQLSSGGAVPPNTNMMPLFQAIVKNVPPPVVKPDGPFSMLVTSIEYDSYVGRISTGRVYSGRAVPSDTLKAKTVKGEMREAAKVQKVFCRRGTQREELKEAIAGDIVSLAGIPSFVSDTITNDDSMDILPSPPLDPPTIAVTISPNTSPLNGKDGGKHLTAAVIRDRLFKEAENNVAIQVFQSATSNEAFEVHGRGELQMGILMETMRREGFEMTVSPPKVLFREQDGKKTEPIEEVVMEIEAELSGIIMDKMKMRGATLLECKEQGDNRMRLIFLCPSRTLMGYRSEFKVDTKGMGVMYSVYHSHQEYKPEENQVIPRGVMVATEKGTATAWSLDSLQPRGVLFIEPGTEVYEGMVIGEHNRPDDLQCNPAKKKQLSNVRSVGKEEAIRLFPPRILTLEDAITYIREDEMIEVTPKNIRLRKRILSTDERIRANRKTK